MLADSDWYKNCFYRVSLKAVILDEANRVLVVRENNNPNWNLPGGGMDYGESEYEALKRELYEEVGFEGDFVHQPLGVRPMHLEQQQVWQLWVVFFVKPDNLNFQPGPDADDVQFIEIDEFKDSRPHVYRFSQLARDTNSLG